MSKKLIGIVLSILVAAVAGYVVYTENQALQKTEVEFGNAGAPEVELPNVIIPVEAEFRNSSSYDSPPIKAEYEILLNDEKVGEGTTPEITVPANGSTSIEQKISLSTENVGKAFLESITTGDIEVRVEGNKKAKVLFGLIPVSESFQYTYSPGPRT